MSFDVALETIFIDESQVLLFFEVKEIQLN